MWKTARLQRSHPDLGNCKLWKIPPSLWNPPVAKVSPRFRGLQDEGAALSCPVGVRVAKVSPRFRGLQVVNGVLIRYPEAVPRAPRFRELQFRGEAVCLL